MTGDPESHGPACPRHAANGPTHSGVMSRPSQKTSPLCPTPSSPRGPPAGALNTPCGDSVGIRDDHT
eukprot:3461439-Pyramimonas_sp.AAC.1